MYMSTEYIQCSFGGAYEICLRVAGCREVDGGTKCAVFSSASECGAACNGDCNAARAYVEQKTYSGSASKSTGKEQDVFYCNISNSKLKYSADVVPLPDPVSVCKSVLTVSAGSKQEQFIITQKCPLSITCSSDGTFSSLDVYASQDIYRSVQSSYSAIKITG